MIVVEILVGLIIATIIITGIAKIGAPIAESFAAKLKLKYEELGPEEERQLLARVASLEEEVRTLKKQLADIQAAVDFGVKLSNRSEEEQTQGDQPSTLKMAMEKEKR